MADFSRRNCGFGWCRHLHGICRGTVRRRLSYGTGRARAAWRGVWSYDDSRRPWPYAALSHPRFFRRDRHLHMRGRGGASHHLLYPPSIHGYAIPRSGVSSRGRGRFGVHRGHRDWQLITKAPLGSRARARPPSRSSIGELTSLNEKLINAGATAVSHGLLRRLANAADRGTAWPFASSRESHGRVAFRRPQNWNRLARDT